MILRKRTLALFTLLQLNLYSEVLADINIETKKLSDTQMNSSSTVNILSKEDIEIYKIENIKDLSSSLSNVNISGIGNRSDNTFTFRGVSNYLAYQSSVAMYIDNIPLPFSFGYGALNINEVQNIEILKGPQGTLFGKNAESGVINIFTKKPTKNQESELIFNIAKYNSQKVFLKTSGPTAIKNLTYFLSLSENISDGYSFNALTNNRIDTRKLQSLNSKFKYILSDEKEIDFTFIKIQTEDGVVLLQKIKMKIHL